MTVVQRTHAEDAIRKVRVLGYEHEPMPTRVLPQIGVRCASSYNLAARNNGKARPKGQSAGNVLVEDKPVHATFWTVK